MMTIFRREIGQYFASPIAYLIAAAFLLVTGLIFNNDLTSAIGNRAPDPAAVPLFLSFAMVFFAPLLTMRMLAEETREGTLELLLTAPVTDTNIVLGKFLSAWAYYSVLLLVALITQIVVLSSIATPDLGHTFAAYLGIWLYGGAALAVGVLFSATTENQIVAAFLSMSFLLLMWLGDLAGEIVGSIELANLIRKLSLQGHYGVSFAFGLVRAEDVVYYAGIIVIALFISIRIVESRRWR
ncbi:MAG: ABC transporter permease [Anaerolineae bacterium]